MTNVFNKYSYPELVKITRNDNALFILVALFRYENISKGILKVDMEEVKNEYGINQYRYAIGMRRLRLLGIVEDLVESDGRYKYYKINLDKVMHLI